VGGTRRWNLAGIALRGFRMHFRERRGDAENGKNWAKDER
jgi:hypothetical protein